MFSTGYSVRYSYEYSIGGGGLVAVRPYLVRFSSSKPSSISAGISRYTQQSRSRQREVAGGDHDSTSPQQYTHHLGSPCSPPTREVPVYRPGLIRSAHSRGS